MDSFDPQLNELQRRFDRLSPAPRIANSLRALVADGTTNPDEIIALIRLEPLLAARLMREANQEVGSRPQGYTSIEEAATAMGYRRMRALLDLHSFPATADAAHYSTGAWKRAITCAVCMESLAEKHRLDRHQAYTIGLLHSLASAILERPERTRDAAASSSCVSLSHRFRSFDASGLAYALLRDWGLPRAVTDPVRYQYAPLDCQTTGKMACLLNLAKWITGVIREVDELPDQALGPDVLVLNLLGEGEQTLWNLVTEVSDSLQQADELLQGKQSAC